MNTAFDDAANLAWKIHHVKADFADRSLSCTYESERMEVAEDLLSIDAKYTDSFSKRKCITTSHGKGDGDQNRFTEVFKANSEVTAGYGVAYHANKIDWSPSFVARSPLSNREHSVPSTGRVMPYADVTRVMDANPVH